MLMEAGEIKQEYNNILDQLRDPELISDPEKMELLMQKKDLYEKILEKQKQIEELQSQIEENNGIIATNEDPELTSLALTEISQIKEKIKIIEKEKESLFKSKEKATSPQAVIVEIRAGTGGEEAGLFVNDLFRMYSRYASLMGWQQKTLNSNSTEIGGLKEIIFELAPSRERPDTNDVWSFMKYEAGVHRVQRIPETEKSGRIHTSTISVAVLPKPKTSSQIKIRSDDLKIEFYRASGPGGQNVNKRETAVRIIHLPTGVTVTSQTERSQLNNRQNALIILEAKLMEKQLETATENLSGKRKEQIGWAKRSEKIRTYNFPQDRITDHRIKKAGIILPKFLMVILI
ncbi:MAG: PCRF domain-containing protein [bacterium]